MPMRIPLVLASLSLVATSAAGEQIDAETPEAATPWTSLAANDAAEDFHFVIVSDRTGGERPGVFESALPKTNLLEPAFVVSIGDLIEGYTEDQAQIDAEWDEFEGFVERLEAPFFYVAGNHDMNNAVMAEDLAGAVRSLLLPLRLQGRALPCPQLGVVRHGERAGYAGARAVDASRAACLRRTDA